MPRKRKAFIDRAKARTFQIVYRPLKDANGEQHTLVPLQRGEPGDLVSEANKNGVQDGQDGFGAGVSAMDEEALKFEVGYSRSEFELGEFGFPDDGYDYSKHFMTIGGGGGVFMDAATGMPNPDAVAGSSGHSAQPAASRKNQIALKEDGEEIEDGNGGMPTWITPEDAVLRQKAILEIKRERKKDKDLDEIFAALDSEGELEVETDLEETDTASHDDSGDEDRSIDDNALLDDDFVVFANAGDESEVWEGEELLGSVDTRPQRLLDEQFERLMQGYQEEDSDEFDDDLGGDDYGDDDGDDDDAGDYTGHMTADELSNLIGDGGLADGLSALQIEEEVKEDGADDLGLEDAVQNEGMTLANRAAEVEQFTHAEFERGMKGLLDSYNRMSAVEALEAIDGVDVAREAIARNEQEERELLRIKEEVGLQESDGHDSELDSKFEEMYHKDEQWDCETILSTYSNLENHPSVIDAPANLKRRAPRKQPIIRLDPRTQAPEGYMASMGQPGSSSGGPVDYGTRRNMDPTGKGRAKGETKEEKKARKAAVKEAARERRVLKSEMKKAFGSENVKQSRHAAALGTSKVAVQF